jgi:hypothetical protein
VRPGSLRFGRRQEIKASAGARASATTRR